MHKRRDERHFLVLDAMRPQRNALTGPDGLAAAIHAARRRLGLHDTSLGELVTACLSDVGRVVDLLAELRARFGANAAEDFASEQARDGRPEEWLTAQVDHRSVNIIKIE